MKPLRILLDTFAASLPLLLNIGGFTFITLFAFAFLGVLLFGTLQVGACSACSSCQAWCPDTPAITH